MFTKLFEKSFPIVVDNYYCRAYYTCMNNVAPKETVVEVAPLADAAVSLKFNTDDELNYRSKYGDGENGTRMRL